MPYCLKCGKPHDDNSKYCSSCGQPLIPDQSRKNDSRQQDFAGKIVKCPSCGEKIQSFTAKCPTCGHEFRGIDSTDSIKELSHKLESVSSESAKADLIRTFPIPNTKEDIFEFMILASTNIKGELPISVFDAWSVKLSQIYKKAELSLVNTPDFVEIQSLYNKTKKQVHIQKCKCILKHFANRVSKMLIANPSIFLICIGLLFSEYDDASIVLIILGGFVASIMSIYYAKNNMVKTCIGNGIIIIGLACILSEYDDRRMPLFIIGALVFIVYAVTLAKSKQ